MTPGACRQDQRLRVGISIFIRKDGQSLWENGIFQNCLFLAMLLLKSPPVEEVVLVAGGDGGVQQASAFLCDSPVPVVDMATAARRLDLMIEMSAQLDPEWVAGFRARGGRVVSMRVGNDYAIDVERMTFGKPHGLLISGACYDEIWTLPQHEATCVPYYGAALRAPVRLMPHLWSPWVLERARSRAATAGAFDYQPGRCTWRVGIFEPNLCMVKTSFTAMLAGDVAHRARPRMLERLRVYNSAQLVDRPGFVSFAQALDLVRHGLVSFEGRLPLYDVLPSQVDAVLSHHWENAQNYLYYEALHGGFALIHNSHLLGDCGYRYRSFDCEEGGAALLRAFDEHDAQLPGYRERARRFLRTLDPEGEDNVRTYSQAIASIMQGT